MDKSSIREIIGRKREMMSADEIRTLSRIIQEEIITSDAFRKSGVVMAYMPIRNEVMTDLVIEAALDEGKKVCLPRVVDASLMESAPFIGINRDLRISHLNIPEPNQSIPPVNPREIELMIIPGLAFSREGYRIGFGKGYYDRFIPLLEKSCIKIAPAYHFQIIDSIPLNEYDQPVDLVITEKELIRPIHV